MKRYFRTLALLVFLVLTVPLMAQSKTKEAWKIWDDLVTGNREDEKQKTEKLAKEWNAMADEMRKFLLLGDAQLLARKNDFPAAAVKAKQSIEEFQKIPLADLTPEKARILRDARLELGRLEVLKGNATAAAEQANKAWEIHEKMRRPNKPDRLREEMDQIVTELRMAVVQAGSEQRGAAAEYASKARTRCKALPQSAQQPLLAQCCLLEASLAVRNESYPAAKNLSQEALDALGKRYPPTTFPDETEEMAVARINLATALANLGETRSAMVHLREARRCLDLQFPNGHLARIDLYRLLAQLYLLQNDDVRALEAVELARKECHACFPPKKYENSHPQLIQAKLSVDRPTRKSSRVARRSLAALPTVLWRQAGRCRSVCTPRLRHNPPGCQQVTRCTKSLYGSFEDGAEIAPGRRPVQGPRPRRPLSVPPGLPASAPRRTGSGAILLAPSP
jgi:hypothetical protein